MKVIDLLVKIANGEEMPKKIKYKNELFEYDNDTQDYYIVEGTYDYLFRDSFCKKTNSFINDEIEIIEEPKKIKHCLKRDRFLRDKDEMEHFRIKIDELIDEINNLKEK